MGIQTRHFVPLIINGVDIHLTAGASTFEPESLSAASRSQTTTIAQGADIESCHAAVNSSAQAFDSWRQTSAIAKRALLLRLADLVKTKAKEIHAIIQDEVHGTSLWATINVQESILMIEEMAALVTSPSLSGFLPPIQNTDSHALVLVEPLGVILGIAPWNSPLILGFRAVLPAIAAGNTTILKGSELSPRTHYWIASQFREAGFPPGVCNFLLHRGEDAARVFETIIERPEVRKCNFTGSTPVGRAIASRAAAALKPCLMELGGKNFALVLEDADLQSAAKLVCEGAFLNSGQICMSTDTVLVAGPVLAEFREALLSNLEKINKPGNGIKRLITLNSAARVRSLVQDAVSKGAIIHTAPSAGPEKNDQEPDTAMVSATIIEGLNKSMELYTVESFGPLLSILPIQSVAEGIKVVNDCKYGLSSAIHTKNHYQALSLAKKMKVSAVHINGATVHDESTLPHGGHGDSGWGRFGGEWGLQEFVHTKTVIMNC